MNVFTGIDLTGYRQREGEPVWVGGNGVVLSLHYFDLVPDLPAPLRDLDNLRARLAELVAGAGAGLIEAGVEPVDAVPALRQVAKVPRPGGSGLVFLGSYTIPRATCSAVVKLQAAEGPVTGLREALVLDRLGLERCFGPHPYAPGLAGKHGSNAAYASEWDALFPDHPLTLVRAELDRIVRTVRLDPEFHGLPPFPGP